MVMTCDRCKREIFKMEVCNYCKRQICNRCMKSSQRLRKVNRLVICKDCWSDMSKRKVFKQSSARRISVVEKAAERYER